MLAADEQLDGPVLALLTGAAQQQGKVLPANGLAAEQQNVVPAEVWQCRERLARQVEADLEGAALLGNTVHTNAPMHQLDQPLADR